MFDELFMLVDRYFGIVCVFGAACGGAGVEALKSRRSGLETRAFGACAFEA
ncbi:hypothetical protein [Nocardia sp. NBC_01329]|uniref:hypothetical protein n=1 Tax=Nocardia sp. NBC_01329 TaxID=2903594 RepID=UPI002E151DD2|nr:hypothetical protein OG405_24690 [Nocardia sp. NBC_01329]